MIARAVVVLPHPDSPASASTSPRCSSSVTPSTARARSAFLPREPGHESQPALERDVQVVDLDDGGPVAFARCDRQHRHGPGSRGGSRHVGPARIDEQARRATALAGVVEVGIDRRAILECHRAPRVERAPRGHVGCGSGGSPPRPEGLPRNRWSPISGNAAASAAVYGCFGSNGRRRRRGLPR